VAGDAYRTLQTVCPQLTREAGGGAARYCCDERQIHDLSTKIQIATIFLVGCPACAHNFKHFFCELTCSPDQSTFANVTSVQKAEDTKEAAVEEVEYFVSNRFGKAFYDSCKDVIYPIMSQKAMTFVGGGAKNFTGWFAFLGLVKDKRFPKTGSPFQMNFPGEDATPKEMKALNSSLPPCWDAGLRCSCGDCPAAPQCTPIPTPPPPKQPGCTALGLTHIRCSDLGLTAVWLGAMAVLYAAFFTAHGRALLFGHLDTAHSASEGLLNEWSDEKEESWDGEAEPMRLPWVRARLSAHYRRQGRLCAEHPWMVLGVCALAVVLCGLGLLRLHVETEPQKLWVGSRSQALAEKRYFESSFGPFYRVEQLLLSTTKSSAGRYTTPDGLPSILNDDCIELLFEIQAHVDDISAQSQGGREVNLTDVCYKPFGKECATQSLLQYWQMSHDVYKKGDPRQHGRLSPEYCLSHWSTACLAAYGGPQDPHTILGGFPTDDRFRNYTADASTLVVTYLLDSRESNREAAEAWEAAFLRLAEGKLSKMARKAGLRLAFSSERSVADELARESTADAPTVAWSYAAMLVYVTLALSALPKGAQLAAVLVHSRAGLALGGVGCVAAAVLSALGMCSLVGVSSTLIILEVIPFLALAVGVDNMFILAHALGRQPAVDPATGVPAPLPVRVGNALAEAGPSITLAATAETLAFALGGLTPMPAVRNFSLVAALAVLLDFFLQVTAFVAMLALDAARVEEGRLDLLPLLRLPSLLSFTARKPSAPGSDGEGESVSGYQSLADTGFGGDPAGDHSGRCDNGWPRHLGRDSAGEWGLGAALQAYMERIHVPLLGRREVQGVVLVLFTTSLLCGLGMLPRLSRGLEQQVALPRDSYLQDYFQDVTDVMRVGPPLFFVVKDVNMSTHAPDVNRICSTSHCDDNSVQNQIERAARQPTVSYIAAPPASWLDDFLSWASPDIPQCCRAHPDGSRCPPPDQEPCLSDPKSCGDCDPCFQAPPPEDSDGDLRALPGVLGGAGQQQQQLAAPGHGTTPNTLLAYVAAYLHHGRPSLKQVRPSQSHLSARQMQTVQYPYIDSLG